MSSTSADQPPSTPDGVAGVASPMPPPPPFNTPAGGEATSMDVPVALGAVGDENGVAGSSLVDKLSGLNVAEGITAGGGGVVEKSSTADTAHDEEGEEEDEEGEEDEVDLPPQVMKRLYQLKALQSEKDVVYEKYKAERAALERKFSLEYGAIYGRRAAIVTGQARDAEGAESEGTAEGEGGELGVPHFWMQCMLHHEALHEVVCEPDLEALFYLSDVRCADKDDLLGFTLEFHFDDNPYFTNSVLTKRYDTANIMDQGEPLLEGVEGTPIEWKGGRNLCEKTIRKKVKRGGSRSGEMRTITKVEKRDSFFKFFQNPVMYDEEDEEEDDDEYNFSFDMDYEVARIFRNHLIPNAVLWFTGEAVSDDVEELEDDEEGDLDTASERSDDDVAMRNGGEESEQDGEEAGVEAGALSKALHFQAPEGFEAPPSGSAGGAQECKQS